MGRQEIDPITRFRAVIDNAYSKAFDEGPDTIAETKDGGSVVIHHRSTSERDVTDIRFPSGEIFPVTRKDILHQYDSNGRLVDRKKVKDLSGRIDAKTLPPIE